MFALRFVFGLRALSKDVQHGRQQVGLANGFDPVSRKIQLPVPRVSFLKPPSPSES